MHSKISISAINFHGFILEHCSVTQEHDHLWLWRRFENEKVYYEDQSTVSVSCSVCLTLCDPMDCSLPGSSVCGILQARILEGVVISFSRVFSWPRNWTWVSHIAGRFLLSELPGKLKVKVNYKKQKNF